jgi:ABC-2 type transport system permease protein
VAKYLTIIKITIERALTFRLNILAYRLGNTVEIVMLVILWSLLYREHSSISGLTLPEMISYILIGNLITTIVRNFLSEIVARDIKDGTLSLFLTRPLSYIKFVFFRELGRVFLPALTALLLQSILLIALHNTLIIPLDPYVWLLLLGLIALVFIIELLIAFIFGLVAFWTDETDGIYSSVLILKKFFSGSYFPLSLLPAIWLKISFLSPLKYT